MYSANRKAMNQIGDVLVTQWAACYSRHGLPCCRQLQENKPNTGQQMDHRFTTLQHWRIVTTSDIEDNRTTVSDQVQSLDHCNSLRDTRETTVTARGIHDDAAAAAGNGH